MYAIYLTKNCISCVFTGRKHQAKVSREHVTVLLFISVICGPSGPWSPQTGTTAHLVACATSRAVRVGDGEYCFIS